MPKLHDQISRLQDIAQRRCADVDRFRLEITAATTQLAEVTGERDAMAGCCHARSVAIRDAEEAIADRDRLTAENAKLEKSLGNYRDEADQLGNYIQNLGVLMGCSDGDDTPEIRWNKLVEENTKLLAALEEAHSTDRIKTREINLLTEENKKLISAQKALRTGGNPE